MEDLRPVLYLDVDDTLVSWATGAPVAATDASNFLSWALQHYEVRWLTSWCPSGVMPEPLLRDLAAILRRPLETLLRIRGLDWTGTLCKLNGIAWLEHLVWERPFAWLEDEKGFGERERRFLERHGMLPSYYHCNVTRDAESLKHAWQALRRHQHRAMTSA